MIDEKTTDEYFKARFYSNVLLNWKQEFEVDTMIDEHTRNE